MQGYKLFVLDDAGRVVEELPFRTDDDHAACAWSQHIAGDRRFELWHEKRRVHCSHEGPSVLEAFFDLGPQMPPPTVYYAACAVARS